MPRYHCSQCTTIAVLTAIAAQYHCKITVGIDGRDIYAMYNGRVVKIGDISAIKDYTVRAIIAIFEELTQEWRYGA